MEIHAPDKPVEGLRDFFLHIGIVTIGILIALSLEGVREVWHNHELVHDSRETFRRELTIDRDHIGEELARVREVDANVKSVLQVLPALAHNPDELNKKLQAKRNPGYFFFLGSWEAALSTGALAHMPSEEVLKYAVADTSIRTYSSLQMNTLNAEDDAIQFFEAHPNPDPQELRTGTEKLLHFSSAEEGLAHVGEELQSDIEHAYEASGH